MAVLQLGRFALLTPFARAAGAVPVYEESQTWRLQADSKNARSVAMFRKRWLAARRSRNRALQPVHQKHKPQGRDV
jgi:hypothetical protein